MDRKEHWEKIYRDRLPTEVSWYQVKPQLSISLILATGIGKDKRIIDVGGGASKLVDHLLDLGFNDLTILDVSSTALERNKSRLGERAKNVTWLEADITKLDRPEKYDLWHDRAVFHFLTSQYDINSYIEVMNKALRTGGHLIISTFSLEGPPKCSGLDVVRYSPESLHKEIGENIELLESKEETHITPSQVHQKFIYCRLIKIS